MGKIYKLEGMIFGRLTVLAQVENTKDGHKKWLCLCSCGVEVKVCGSSLIGGSTKSCGCLRGDIAKECNSSHKMSGSRTYTTWQSMKRRCNLPKDKDYKNYGARGIKVCNRWSESFDKFLEDMGDRPIGMSIDRIDVNGDYEPDNCRWTSFRGQANNRRNTVFITYDGITLSLSDWADELSIPQATIWTRRLKGWSPEECLFGRKKGNPMSKQTIDDI